MTRARFGIPGCCVLAFAIAGCGRTGAPRPGTVAEVRRLSAEQVRAVQEVRIAGVVTYSDELSRWLLVQDSTGGIRVVPAPGQTLPKPGWSIVAAGFPGSAGASPSIIDARLVSVAQAALPVPADARGHRLAPGEHQYERVTIEGVVRSAVGQPSESLELELGVRGLTVNAHIPYTSNLADRWVDATVRAIGVLAWTFEPGQKPARPILWLPDLAAVEILQPARAPEALPVGSIGSYTSLEPSRLPEHRVRVRGARQAPAGGGLGVVDETGQMRLRLAPSAFDDGRPRLDVTGFLISEKGRVLLDQAMLAEPAGIVNTERQSKGPLTTARQVHTLDTAAAQLGYPVQLEAVVTYFDGPSELLFVQDRTDGIFVRTVAEDRLALKAGDLVEVTGASIMGFAPDVNKARVRVIGRAPLPEPRPGSNRSAFLGEEDCRLIELGGVVRSVTPTAGGSLLTLAWGRERYQAHVQADAHSLARLVDCEVTIRGVCAAIFNGKRQLMGIELYVPGAEQITVVRQGADRLLAAPLRPVADLLRFSPERGPGHAVRVRGTVLYNNRAGSLWMRDASGAVLAEDVEGSNLLPGDTVEAAGFPEMRGLSAVLRSAGVGRLSPGEPPHPIPVAAEEVMNGGFDGQLVRMEGTVLDRLIRPAEQVLTLESGDLVYTATIAKKEGTVSVEPGEFLSVTGICAMNSKEAEGPGAAGSFRLIVRSPADIQIREKAAWLKAGLIAPVLAGACVLTAGALIWVRLLRRRVKAQTAMLSNQTKRLGDANRLTHEALARAQEAESMERERKLILELVARDEPIDRVMGRIAAAVAAYTPGTTCAIALPEWEYICAAPPVPDTCLRALERVTAEIGARSGSGETETGLEIMRKGCDRPFAGAVIKPIVVEFRVAGMIAVFFEDATQAAAAEDQASTWRAIAGLALERRKLYDTLSHRAKYDSLTGLPNRAVLYERFESEMARAAENGSLLGVLYADLDEFKQVNDTFGHAAGDLILQESAKRMVENVRRGDTVARIGGDEFVMLLPLLRCREDAEEIADKLTAALKEPVAFEHGQLRIGMSLGVAVCPDDGKTPEALLHRADTRMYSDKTGKRRRWHETPLSRT